MSRAFKSIFLGFLLQVSFGCGEGLEPAGHDKLLPGLDTNSLNGQWLSRNCWDHSDILTFDGSTFTRSTTAYFSTRCTNSYAKIDRSGEYLIGGTLDKPVASQIDFQVQKLAYTALDPEKIQSLNDIKFCEIDDWEVNVPRDITGQTCLDGQSPFVHRPYDIVAVDDDELSLGAATTGFDGQTPEHRPQELDDFFFTYYHVGN